MAMSSPSPPSPEGGKRANPETQVEVDVMILDYLLYMAARQVIAGRKAQRSGVVAGGSNGAADAEYGGGDGDERMVGDMPLMMVDSFLPIFKANHPTHLVPESTHSRLLLLKFSTLFVHRLQRSPSTPPLPSLQHLRARNHARATTWLSHHPPSQSATSIFNDLSNGLPIPPQSLHQNRRHVLSHNCPPNTVLTTPDFYGTPACLSLRDTLPAFMELSAYITSTYKSGRVNETWEKMAAEYMLQAALEAYLVYGESGDAALRECFAWGFDAEAMDGDAGEGGFLVNTMFWDEDQSIMEKWARIRNEHMQALAPPPQTHLQAHLETVATRFPLFRFEGRLLDFLWALTRHETAPVLAQLETGCLDGFSREETEALTRRVGIQIN
ncbi:hypothetical protein FGG08_001757 [Glutinoglossum americanum]|uniref:Uncharacterized protein n=1 Tax=Glutinoglossum americanum TaxID=1670608 RepID=A0A9P8I6B9_9PEZI|nr:hypothetical protein FGG08_001757 [Glutinoglossum americanum]